MERDIRHLRQAIVMRKDLKMPPGKAAAMAGHAAMTFIVKKVFEKQFFVFTPDEERWLTELDSGIEGTKQVIMPKIVLAVDSEAELLEVEARAKAANLTCHRVIDGGYAHNPVGTFVCIAIGPDWPEKLGPVTGTLKLYK